MLLIIYVFAGIGVMYSLLKLLDFIIEYIQNK
jgi:hypothetical protein